MKTKPYRKKWRWVPRSHLPLSLRDDKREVSFIAKGQTVEFRARRRPTPEKLAARRIRRQGNKLAAMYRRKGLTLPKKICI